MVLVEMMVGLLRVAVGRCWGGVVGGGRGGGGGGGIGLGMEVGQVVFHRYMPHQEVTGGITVFLPFVGCEAQMSTQAHHSIPSK